VYAEHTDSFRYGMQQPHYRLESVLFCAHLKVSVGFEPRPKKTLIFTRCQRPKPLITTLQAGPYVSSPQNYQPPNIFFPNTFHNPQRPRSLLRGFQRHSGTIQTLSWGDLGKIRAALWRRFGGTSFNPIHHPVTHNQFPWKPLRPTSSTPPAPRHLSLPAFPTHPGAT
jgi:hypothetical protein